MQHVVFSMFVRHSGGVVVYDTSSDLLAGKYFFCEAEQIFSIRFEFIINLLRGVYNLGFNILGSLNGGVAEFLEYKNNVFTFTVEEKTSQQGIADLRASCDIQLKI